MASTYIGSVAIFAADGLTISVAGLVISAADFKLTGANMTDSYELAEHKDGEGHTQGLSAAGREQSASFTIIPMSTADAQSSGSGVSDPATQMTEVRENIKLPTPLATVVIAGTGAGIAPFCGNWAYVGGSISFTSSGIASMVINCERYNDSPATQTLFGA